MPRIIVLISLALSLFWAIPALATQTEYEIAVTRATMAIDKGSPESALADLHRALEIKPSDKQATLLLGIAFSRAGMYLDAKEALLESIRLAPDNWRGRFELGVVYFNLNDLKNAEEIFNEVKRSTADDLVKTTANRYLEMIALRRITEKEPFSLAFLTGVQYDTNVILEPSEPLVGRGREENWRAIFAIDGDWTFFNKSGTSGKTGYSFYQNFHDTLDDFDLQQHNLRLLGKHQFTSKVKAELNYDFTYSRVGNDHFSDIHNLGPALFITHSPRFSTELFYYHKFKNFFNGSTFPFNSQRSGDNDFIGISENIQLMNSTAMSIGYAFDRNSTDENAWSYDGHKGFLKLGSSFGKLHLFFEASYYDRNYDGKLPGFDKKRDDETQEYSVNLVWTPNSRVSISLSDLFINNDSNIRDADYKRNITGLLFEVRL